MEGFTSNELTIEYQNLMFLFLHLSSLPSLVIYTGMRSGIAPFGGTGGTGLVLARLPNGSWSAPSAISPNNLSAGLLLGEFSLSLSLSIFPSLPLFPLPYLLPHFLLFLYLTLLLSPPCLPLSSLHLFRPFRISLPLSQV